MLRNLNFRTHTYLLSAGMGSNRNLIFGFQYIGRNMPEKRLKRRKIDIMTDTHFAILHTWGHADGVQKFSFERSFKNVLFTKRFRTVFFFNVYIKEKR